VPFEPSPGLYIRETIRILDAMDITAAQREQIYRGNALKFLKPSKALSAV
jgi:predicted TIM-barrel fold metal-dependent hydrolase